MSVPTGVFISYSHKDQEWLERITTALKPLVHGEIIKVWDDRSIPPGSNWLDEINSAIASARIAVLLVSQEFLASSFIHRREFPELIVRRKGGMGFFWVPLEATLYQFTPLKDIQSAWSPDAPLAGLDAAQRSSALVSIANKIASWRPSDKLE
jgi:TIR domain